MVDLCPKVKWFGIEMASEYRTNFEWPISPAYVLWSENWSGFQMIKNNFTI
jgi:hypothetical protein